MVDRTGLENRSPFTRTVGSNPTPSAPTSLSLALQRGFRRLVHASWLRVEVSAGQRITADFGCSFPRRSPGPGLKCRAGPPGCDASAAASGYQGVAAAWLCRRFSAWWATS